jgi:hypothetical protein
MVIVLKVILALLVVAEVFVGRYMILDFLRTRKSENYENSSIWGRFTFNAIFFFVMTALISLAIFFFYFIFSSIQIS